MTGTLATFADQVTTVAREGRRRRDASGGRPTCPGAAGTWKDLTGQRQPARGESDDAGSRHRRGRDRRDQGDLTRSIQVEAAGEVAELKDNINTMIDNLRLTTDRNTEQDWF
jgi:hypothetical protein